MAQTTNDATAEQDFTEVRGKLESSDPTLLLHAETLDVRKRHVSEQVIVRTETRSRDVAIEEPLQVEQIVIEHVHVGQFVEEMPPTREEGDTTIVPIVEEVAVVVKRLFLSHEVHIHKVRSSSTHVETVTLREQHAVVTRTERMPEAIDVGINVPRLNSSHATPRSLTMEHEETIVAVYDTPAHAELAVNDLREARVPEAAISRHDGQFTAETTSGAPVREKGFWATLFGGETYDDEHVYEQSAQSGSSIVAVKTPMHDVDAVVEILERHNPVNLDERAASYGATTGAMTSGATTTAATMAPAAYDRSMATTAIPSAAASYADRTAATAATGDTVQLSEEQLTVGKRLVNRGGTRLRRYVVETPVQEDVFLRSETVQVDRRPVAGGAIANPDFSEKTIEMTATSEEAVVGKTARVVEEVSLRKEASERVETVRDTVRKEEVEVEQIPAAAKVETTTTKPITTTTDTTAARVPKI